MRKRGGDYLEKLVVLSGPLLRTLHFEVPSTSMLHTIARHCPITPCPTRRDHNTVHIFETDIYLESLVARLETPCKHRRQSETSVDESLTGRIVLENHGCDHECAFVTREELFLNISQYFDSG